MDTEITKRGRGRPRQNALPEKAPKAVIEPKRTKPVLTRQNSSFYLVLRQTGDSRTLQCVDAKGKSAFPDYRMFSGVHREIIRTFVAERQRKRDTLQWESLVEGRGANEIDNPSTALIELALSAGILLLDNLAPCILADGHYRCSLRVENPRADAVTVTVVLRDPESDTLIQAPSKGFTAISPTLLLAEETVYRVSDLGPWFDTLEFATVTLAKGNLEAFLSLARSRISTVHIEAPGWETRIMRPITARKALLFSEIDAYGYLHIKPVVHLPGYPPDFFEEQELVETVTIDAEASQIRIAEILYPEDPAQAFRSLIPNSKLKQGSVFEEAGYFLLSGDFAEIFLYEKMQDLMADFTLLQSSVLGKFKVKIVKPFLKLSLSSGIDFLEGNADVEIENERIPFGVFMSQYKKNAYITLSDGSKAWPEQEDINRFERLITKVKGKENSVSVSFFDVPALEKLLGIEADGEGWKSAATFYKKYNSISKRKGNYGIAESELRPYQEYGVKWLEYLRDNNMGACLADEMGLGKTIQIITLLRNSYREGMKGPSLILVPRSLIYNWQAELARFAPELEARIHYGTGRENLTVPKKKSELIISSYATLRNDIEAFTTIDFCFVILDESQNIKNLETKTTAAVLSLKAKHRIAMSGTPIENRLSDLYSLFRFLNPAFFGSQENFMQRYQRPIQDAQDESALKDLRSRLYPFLLRRAKKDVLSDLPDKTEQTSFIELSKEHLWLYNLRREEIKARIAGAVRAQGIHKSAFLILQALTELRRLAGVPEAEGDFDGVSAKREFLKDMAVSIAQEGHKCLIFTNFLATVDLVSQDLADAGIGNLVMTGATRDRQSLVERFQTDPSISAFIMTIKTGGVGLNLTAADYVFILDPWWNRAAEQQAIDRTHRIGQKNPVFCYRMIAKETIEEKILELQEKKAGLAEALLSADGSSVKNLTEADIEYLMG